MRGRKKAWEARMCAKGRERERESERAKSGEGICAAVMPEGPQDLHVQVTPSLAGRGMYTGSTSGYTQAQGGLVKADRMQRNKP